MTDQMTPAERLRAAATLLRERAEAAPPEPWKYAEHGNVVDGPTEVRVMSAVYEDDPLLVGGYDSFSGNAAILAATMHPGVALALADWLDAAAREEEAFGRGDRYPLAVADAVLGGERS